jgi:hypothetical protein
VRVFAQLNAPFQIVRFLSRRCASKTKQLLYSITNVKAIAGFSRCRFVYTAQIDLACYIGSTLGEADREAISAKLNETADSIGTCLTNNDLVRKDSEPGSTPSIGFGGGARQPYWQVSMVPVEDDPSRLQPELLVLGPAPVTQPARSARPTPKAKRKLR